MDVINSKSKSFDRVDTLKVLSGFSLKSLAFPPSLLESRERENYTRCNLIVFFRVISVSLF